MKNTCLIIVSIVVTITLVISIKIINENNNKKNNIVNNKDIQEIEKSLLGIEEYRAIIDVTIISNKNENKYVIEQEVKNNYERQIVMKPEELANMEIIYSNGILQIKNSKGNNNKIYNNYPYFSNNNLFLTDFLKRYKESKNSRIEEHDDDIVLSFNSNNKYSKVENLKIEKQSQQPKELEIIDENNQRKVYILYDEIVINNI